MGRALAPGSPWADRGLCSRTASGGWKEEELGERGTVLGISGNGEETRRGSAAGGEWSARSPSALCSSGFLLETFQGALARLPSSTLGLVRAGRARKRVP